MVDVEVPRFGGSSHLVTCSSRFTDHLLAVCSSQFVSHGLGSQGSWHEDHDLRFTIFSSQSVLSGAWRVV